MPTVLSEAFLVNCDPYISKKQGEGACLPNYFLEHSLLQLPTKHNRLGNYRCTEVYAEFQKKIWRVESTKKKNSPAGNRTQITRFVAEYNEPLYDRALNVKQLFAWLPKNSTLKQQQPACTLHATDFKFSLPTQQSNQISQAR